ncbi:MAG TPA: DUF488 domain-containing protein [Burkholderiales bacterium]|nr:DUF488 domain-containing protein [Burkholderiales bacterium]
MIYTVGHGNRSIEEFVGLLRDAAIECLVDVRAYPASRRHPQFARASLESSLAEAGICYVWEGTALGGRRKPEPNSPHVALKNPGFRAYAGHMASEEFRQALDRLAANGRGRRTAIMCAERLPWRCHRYLLADSLVARGVRVLHLVNPGQGKEHALNQLARVDGERLVYDTGEQPPLAL